MSSLASELTGWMWTEVGHVPAWDASIMMSSLDAEKVQLSTIKEESTEQIANRIVKLGSKGIWVLKPNTANPKGPADEQIDITLTTTTPDFLPASPAIPENPPPKKSRAASLSPRLPFFAPSMSYPRSYDMNYRSISR